MTLALRNRLLLWLGTLGCLFFAAFVVGIVSQGSAMARMAPATNLAGIAVMSVTGAASPFLIHYFFNKTSSAEIFFAAIFLGFSSLEALRLVPLFVEGSAIAITVTRAAMLDRFLGLFAMFAASFYSLGVSQKGMGGLAVASITVSTVLASQVPVHNQELMPSLVFPVGFLDSLLLVMVCIGAFGFMNYLVAWRTKGGREYLIMGLAMIGAIAGKELALWSPNLAALIIGLALYAGSAYLYGATCHRLYMWN